MLKKSAQFPGAWVVGTTKSRWPLIEMVPGFN
jgi:hypothetical protein